MTQPKSKQTRRTFLTTAALGLGLSGCSGRLPNELNVFCYAGNHEAAMKTAFVPVFEAAAGASVNLHAGWWDALAKLKTAPRDNPPYDLMITDATQGHPAARDGLFAEIDFTNVPNVAALSSAVLDSWVYRDRLGLPYPDSTMTLAFHETSGAKLIRWADLLRPELAGKIGLYKSFYMSLYTFAAMLADVSGQPGTAHDLVRDRTDEVFRFAREHRERVGLWWGNCTEMLVAMDQRQVAAGNMHGADYLVPLKEKLTFRAAVPVADRAMVQVFWAIPVGCQRKSLAEVALNLLFSEEVQLGFARQGLATPRLDVAAKMAAEDPLWATFNPHTIDHFRTLRYYPYNEYAKNWDVLADRWDRTILRG